MSLLKEPIIKSVRSRVSHFPHASEAFQLFPWSLHPLFRIVHKMLGKWFARFPDQYKDSFLNDIVGFFSFFDSSKMDCYLPHYLFRLLLSIDWMQKKLFRNATAAFGKRAVLVRVISSRLAQSFSSKPIVGCVLGVTLRDKYENLDEDHLFLIIERLFPGVELIKEMSYVHAVSSSSLVKILYLEIGKKSGLPFTMTEKARIGDALHETLAGELPRFVPSLFMRRNQEEVYKNILTLSQQISSTTDLPHVTIALDRQTPGEIIFFITLVYISHEKVISLQPVFYQIDPSVKAVSEQLHTVAYFEKKHPITAHLIQLDIPCQARFFRSDGSINFYTTRSYVAHFLKEAIGEYRDCNGGIIIKQEEHLASLREIFADVSSKKPELLEDFFYSLMPLEKQSTSSLEVLEKMFALFLEGLLFKPELATDYFSKVEVCDSYVLISMRVPISSLAIFEDTIRKHLLTAWSVLKIQEYVSFSAIVESDIFEEVYQALQDSLTVWSKQLQFRKTLRIALEMSLISFDPRVGGDESTSAVARLMFEGLVSLSPSGDIELAAAESIDISPDGLRYLFTLKSSFWNDGTPVEAYDFEYAWKSILNPQFPPSFAYYFYPIKNARQAKEGTVSLSDVGVKALNEKQLLVELDYPCPTFLKWLSFSIFAPVHRKIDHQSPKWAYQSGLQLPCNGLFQLHVNHPSEGCQLVKNPFHRKASSTIVDQINFIRLSPHDAHRLFHKNEIDWLGHPFAGWHSFFESKEEGLELSFFQEFVQWVTFNTTKSPWSHRKVREALSLAVDRIRMAERVSNQSSPAYTPLYINHSRLKPNPSAHYDESRARELLKEALLELNLERLPLLHVIYPLKEERQSIVEFLQESWKNIGVEVHFQEVEWGVLLNQVRQGSFEAIMMGWFSRIDDPTYTLNAFRYPCSTMNFSRWQNVEYTSLLDAIDKESSIEARNDYLAKVEEILCREYPVVPLLLMPLKTMIRRDVKKMIQISHSLIHFSEKQ
jgi:oligopeptide transport system substrate-binding protein